MSKYGRLDTPSFDDIEDDVFGSYLKTENITLADLNSVKEISVDNLTDFDAANRHHPFHVFDDAAMDKLVESITENGILVPILARKVDDDIYEIISGHRRCHAARKAGFDTVPCIIKDMDDDTATIAMVDSNYHRDVILPSEKAFAYKYKLEALKSLGKSSNYDQSREEVGAETGETGRTVANYIRLTELIPELLDLTDVGSLSLVPAVQLSHLSKANQKRVFKCIETTVQYPNATQANLIRQSESDLSGEDFSIKVMQILSGSDKIKKRAFKMPIKRINEYFDDSYTSEDIEKKIYELLDAWKKEQ